MFAFVVGSIGVAWSVAVITMSSIAVRKFFAFYALLTATAVMFSDPSRPPGSWAVVTLLVFALLDIGDRYMRKIDKTK